MENKTQGQILEEQLLMKKVNGAELLSDEEIAKADEFCEGYKKFLKNAKTERGAVIETVKILEQNGYQEFDPDKKYTAGDKVYYINRGKACAAFWAHGKAFGNQQIQLAKVAVQLQIAIEGHSCHIRKVYGIFSEVGMDLPAVKRVHSDCLHGFTKAGGVVQIAVRCGDGLGKFVLAGFTREGWPAGLLYGIG